MRCPRSWYLTLITIVALAAFGGGMALAFKRLRPLFRERGKINAEVTGRLNETLGGIRIVKTYTAEKREELVFTRGVNRLFRNIAQSITGVSAITAFSTVVVGVGLNVRMPAAAKRDIEQPVSDLTAVAGRGALPIDRNRLLARLVAELASAFAAYAETGFPPFAAEWQRRHAYQGKPVKLLLPDGASVKGTVAGVDSTGALVLADGPRRARFLSGEISLRRA